MIKSISKQNLTNTAKEHPNTGYMLLFLEIVLTLIIIGGTHVNAMSLLALAISAGAVVLMSRGDVVALVVFIMPFANIFKISPDS